jgi:hypothetical protein
MAPAQHWGLLGCGRAGQTEVDVDQSRVGEEVYALEMSRPSWSLRCRIAHPRLVETLASFLTGRKAESMRVGTLEGIPVQIRRDREFEDRFFIVAGARCGRIELTIAGRAAVSELSDALLQAAEDLKASQNKTVQRTGASRSAHKTKRTSSAAGSRR